MSQPSQSACQTSSRQILKIDRSDRWQIYQRLQELDVPCGCSDDGQLWVDIPTPTLALQLRSVIQHLTSPRPVLVQWLNHCWQQSL